MVPATSTGAAPGAGTASTANITPGSTLTDFYGGWYARDLGYYEVITYHELKFIEAEAYFRAGNKTAALASLKEGIRAHIRKMSGGGVFSPPPVTFPAITSAQIEAYIASAAVPQTEAALTLRAIMEQKYIAMFLNPDSWSDLRRLDFDPAIYVNFQYPVYSSGTGPLLGKYPRRLLPGATEVTVNPNAVAANYAEVGATSDQDYVTKPLWFDMP